MLKNYLKIAFRNIIHHKGYSSINIAGLAIGLTATILILIWVQNELSYDKFHANVNNLYRVAFATEDQQFHGAYLPGPAADFLREQYPEITHATSVGTMGLKLTHEQKNLTGSGRLVHPDFFEMFTFPMIQGDPNSVFSNPTSIVITENLATRLFGDQAPIGKTITLEDGYAFTVTGVMQDIPHNSHIQFDFLLSFVVSPPWMNQWDNKAVYTYVMLQENVPYQSVSEKIRNVHNDHNPNSTKNNLYLQPLSRIHLHALDGGGPIIGVYIFSSMALLILLIACINFTNLATARSQKRYKEIGIKKIVGSSRMRLIYQFLSESIILSFIAMIVAVLLTELLIPSIRAMLGIPLILHYSENVVIMLIGIALLTGIFAGSYPAFFLSSFRPIAILKGQYSAITPTKGQIRVVPLRGSMLRRILVVSQFTLSIFFIVCVIVFFNQLDYIRSKNLGYNKDHVLILTLRGETGNKSRIIKQELVQNPNVESASLSSYGLTEWHSSTGVTWEGKLTEDMFDVGCNRVDHDYLETYELQMVQGRFFSEELTTDKSNAFVVNEALVRAMNMENPVGKWVTRAPGSSFEQTGTIIGVIKDYHTESLHGEIRPFMLQLNESGSIMNIRIKPDNIPETISSIESSIRKFVPTDTFDYRFLDENINNLYWTERLTSNLIGYFTILAIFISCIGLFGLVSFAAEQRTKEIGIRKTLGATVTNIITLLSKEFLILVTIANIIAWPIAFIAMNQWLNSFAYHINITWTTFVVAAILAMFIGIATVSIQAMKAALANPIKSLRYE